MSVLRELDVRLHDAHVGVWQKDSQDPTFRAEIYRGLVRHLRRRGWAVGPDPRIQKSYPSLNRNHRLGAKGDMRLALEITGRAIQFEFWAETWPINNRNGRRYDFDRRAKMVYLDRLRLELETRKMIAWLARRATVSVSRSDDPRGPERGGITALDFIQRSYSKSWHCDKALGRPVCTQECNSRSGDGGKVEHGTTVWFADRKGRVRRGVAFYNINNMWWVVTDRYGVTNTAAFELLAAPPADLRRKFNSKQRRTRLETELKSAIRTDNFARAALLKRIAFGDAKTYGIWSRKWEAYYGPGYSGYTGDSLAAGRYTWDEAVREVRRVPHILSLVMPSGSLVEAEALSDARAA